MIYYIENATGNITTRAARARSGRLRRSIMFIGGQRLIKGRPIRIDQSRLDRMKDTLKRDQDKGFIIVRQDHPKGRQHVFDSSKLPVVEQIDNTETDTVEKPKVPLSKMKKDDLIAKVAEEYDDDAEALQSMTRAQLIDLIRDGQ